MSDYDPEKDKHASAWFWPAAVIVFLIVVYGLLVLDGRGWGE